MVNIPRIRSHKNDLLESGAGGPILSGTRTEALLPAAPAGFDPEAYSEDLLP